MSYAVVMAVGVLLGSWLSYRARAGESPLPTIRELLPEKPEPAEPAAPPREGIRV
jgi:hypothetical protein